MEHDALVPDVIDHDHAVVAVRGFDGACADGGEVERVVEGVDAENGETAVVGVAPAASGLKEGVLEVLGEQLVDGIGGGGVEIAAEQDGGGGEGGSLFEHGEHTGDFMNSAGAMDAVFGPSRAMPDAEVGGGGLEVEVDDFDLRQVGELESDLLVAQDWVGHLSNDRPAGNDAIGSAVGCGVAVRAEEAKGDFLDLRGVGILEKNDIGIPAGDVVGGVAELEECAVGSGDAYDGFCLIVGGRAGLEQWLIEVAEDFGFVGNGESDSYPDEEREKRCDFFQQARRDGRNEKPEGRPAPKGRQGKDGEAVGMLDIGEPDER